MMLCAKPAAVREFDTFTLRLPHRMEAKVEKRKNSIEQNLLYGEPMVMPVSSANLARKHNTITIYGMT